MNIHKQSSGVNAESEQSLQIEEEEDKEGDRGRERETEFVFLFLWTRFVCSQLRSEPSGGLRVTDVRRSRVGPPPV